MKPTSIPSGRRSLLAVVLIASFTTATTIVRPAETPTTPPAGSDAGATSNGSTPSSQPGAAAPTSPPASALTSSATAPAESSAAADPAPVIELARQFLGGDAVLDGVQSIRYVGTVTADDENQSTRKIEIIVCKPLQQRMTVINEAQGQQRITALDNYDGWTRLERVANPGQGELALLAAPEVRRMRANTWQNIYFYRDIESVGGRIEHRGEAEVEGILCHKLAFVHPRDIQFVRYYDKSNGRLVLTETEAGGTIRERGEMIVQGIRFPKELINTIDGQTSTVVFTQIVVNPDCPPELFAMPKLPVPRFAPPAQ